MPQESDRPQLPILGFSSTYVPDKTINQNRSLSYRFNSSKNNSFVDNESGKYYLIGGLTPSLKIFPYVLSYRPEQCKLRFLKAYKNELDDVADTRRNGILSPIKESHTNVIEASNEKKQSDPANRAFHSSCLIGRFILIFGGKGEKSFCSNEVYGLELESQDWRLVETLDNLDNLYGSDDLYKHIDEDKEDVHLDKTKRKLGPKSRLGHTALPHPQSTDTAMVLFGGLTEDLVYTNDILIFTLYGKADSRESFSSLGLDGGTWSLILPKLKSPRPRSGHTADIINSKMVIFGGNDARYYFNDIWSFNFSSETWTEIKPTNALYPKARSGHACLYVENYLYLLGGKDQSGNMLNDLWRFSFQDLQWEFISSQTLATGSGVFTCKTHLFNGQALIFGGINDLATKKHKFSISTLDLDAGDKFSDSDDETNDLSISTIDSTTNQLAISQRISFPPGNFLDGIDHSDQNGTTTPVNHKPHHFPKPSYQFDDDALFTPIQGEFKEGKLIMKAAEPLIKLSEMSQRESQNQLTRDTLHFDPEDILDNRSLCVQPTLPISPQKIPPTPLATSLNQDLVTITKLLDKLPELVLQDITDCYEAYTNCLSDLTFLKGKVAALASNKPHLLNNRLDTKITLLESSLLAHKSEVWKLKEDRNIYKELLCDANTRIQNLNNQLQNTIKDQESFAANQSLVYHGLEYIDTKMENQNLKSKLDLLEKQLQIKNLHLDKKQAQIELLELENSKLKKDNAAANDQIQHIKAKCEMTEVVIKELKINDFIKGANDYPDNALQELQEICKQIYNKLKMIDRGADPTRHLNSKLLIELEESLKMLHKVQYLNQQLLDELDASVNYSVAQPQSDMSVLQTLYQQLSNKYSDLESQQRANLSKLHQSQSQVLTLDQELQVYETRFKQLIHTNTEVKRRNKAALNAISNLTNGQFTTNGLDANFGLQTTGVHNSITELQDELKHKDFEAWDDQVLQSLGIVLRSRNSKYNAGTVQNKEQLATLKQALKVRELGALNYFVQADRSANPKLGVPTFIHHTHSPSSPSNFKVQPPDLNNFHQRSHSKPQLTTNLHRNRERSFTDADAKGKVRETEDGATTLVLPLTSTFPSIQLVNTLQLHLTRHSKRYSSWVYKRYYS